MLNLPTVLQLHREIYLTVGGFSHNLGGSTSNAVATDRF